MLTRIDSRLAVSWPAVVFRTLRRKNRIGARMMKRASSWLNPDYERQFGRVMKSALREGDVVWDVGANVGHHTRRFLDAVGLRRSRCCD